jgi:hypothetical protein
VWFYCHHTRDGCEQTLSLAVVAARTSSVKVRVWRWNDQGRSAPAAGAVVRAGRWTAIASRNGTARLRLPSGLHALFARQAGRIRSFPESVYVP